MIAVGAIAEECTHGGCDSLAALEAKPDGKHVTEDSAESGESRERVDKLRVAIETLRVMMGEEKHMADGDVPFQCVEHESGDGQALRSGASDVGGADVAAASLANVLSPKDANEEVAERDRPEQIRNDDDSERAMDQWSLWRRWDLERLAQRIRRTASQ